ncbi:MAG: hypothetical protein KJ056_09780, partial [Acidimicrobiia bacterium]|nr:hypothetical protein [Acidimicrobiia bacterium]
MDALDAPGLRATVLGQDRLRIHGELLRKLHREADHGLGARGIDACSHARPGQHALQALDRSDHGRHSVDDVHRQLPQAACPVGAVGRGCRIDDLDTSLELRAVLAEEVDDGVGTFTVGGEHMMGGVVVGHQAGILRPALDA